MRYDLLQATGQSLIGKRTSARFTFKPLVLISIRPGNAHRDAPAILRHKKNHRRFNGIKRILRNKALCG